MNSLEYHSSSGNLLCELSDHLIQFLILEGFAKKCGLPETDIYKRDMSGFSEREFDDVVVNGYDWENVCMLRYGDAGVGFRSFYNRITFHLDEMAPLRKVTPKEYRLMLKPWITKDILEKCEKRDGREG